MSNKDYNMLLNVLCAVDKNLCIPNIFEKAKSSNIISFFTEKGAERFRQEMDTLCVLFERYCRDAGFGELTIIKREISDREILYFDEYQVIIRQ